MSAEFTEFATAIAQQAGRLVLRHFRRSVDVEAKPGEIFDPVTNADRDCERFLREQIRKTYPHHGIKGEEFEDENRGEYTWVLDPIDGTRAFICGLLHWGILIALRQDGQTILGIVYQPFTDEIFVGERGGSWYEHARHRQPIQTRQSVDLAAATMMTTDPRLFVETNQQAAYARLESTVLMSRYGADCYQYAMLAMGNIDLVCETQLKEWDVAALIPLIQNAGGVITDWRGGDATKGGHVLASSSQNLHDQALQTMAYDG